MRTAGRVLNLTAAIGLAVAGLTVAGAAANATPESDGASTVRVVATGLNAPRGLAYDAVHRRVYVAEAGILAQDTSPCGNAERGLPFCFGATGSVYQYAEHGRSGRIVTGLPSAGIPAVDDPGQSVVIGLADLSYYHGRLVGAIGLLGNQAYRDSLGPAAVNMGRAVVFRGNHARSVADIIGFEDQFYANKPEANPYGILTGPFGTLVVNAGGPHSGTTEEGNDLLLVGQHGTVSQLAQFPDQPSPINPAKQIEPVPTRITQGPDGAFYVSELTGAPFQAGVAQVWRVVPGQQPTVYAGGFTTLTGITFDEQGRMVVLETSDDPAPDPFNAAQSAALIRIEHDGTRTVLASGGSLLNAGGVAYAGCGTYYVTTETAGPDGTGQLLKIQVRDDQATE